MIDRDDFEKWALSFGWSVDRADDGSYRTMTTDAAWGAWIDARKTERRACHDLALLNGSNCPTQDEWDMAQAIARAIRNRGDMA